MRYGYWMPTYTGRVFWPLDPREDEVDIRDIAHQLACEARFCGATRAFYSVAQHSVLVSQYCVPAAALHGLLHDASEAYLKDIVTGMKRLPEMDWYKQAEARLMTCIYQCFGLSPQVPGSVSITDRRMLWTERREVMTEAGGPEEGWFPRAEPYSITILPLSPAQAEMAFLQRFAELTDEPVTVSG